MRFWRIKSINSSFGCNLVLTGEKQPYYLRWFNQILKKKKNYKLMSPFQRYIKLDWFQRILIPSMSSYYSTSNKNFKCAILIRHLSNIFFLTLQIFKTIKLLQFSRIFNFFFFFLIHILIIVLIKWSAFLIFTMTLATIYGELDKMKCYVFNIRNNPVFSLLLLCFFIY